MKLLDRTPPPLPAPLTHYADLWDGLPRPSRWARWRRLSHDCEDATLTVRAQSCGCFARWCGICERLNELGACCPDHGRDRWRRTRGPGEQL